MFYLVFFFLYIFISTLTYIFFILLLILGIILLQKLLPALICSAKQIRVFYFSFRLSFLSNFLVSDFRSLLIFLCACLILLFICDLLIRRIFTPPYLQTKIFLLSILNYT